MGCPDVRSSYATPAEVIPDCGQVGDDAIESSNKEPLHVLQDDVPRS